MLQLVQEVIPVWKTWKLGEKKLRIYWFTLQEGETICVGSKCAEIYDESKQISKIIFTSGAELEIEMQPYVLSLLSLSIQKAKNR